MMSKKIIAMALTGVLSIGLLTGCASTEDTSEKKALPEEPEEKIMAEYDDRSNEFKYGYSKALMFVLTETECGAEDVFDMIHNYTSVSADKENVDNKELITGFCTGLYDQDVYMPKEDGAPMTLEECIKSFSDAHEIYTEGNKEPAKEEPASQPDTPTININDAKVAIDEFVDKEIGTGCVVKFEVNGDTVVGNVMEEGDHIATVWFDIEANHISYELYY